MKKLSIIGLILLITSTLLFSESLNHSLFSSEASPMTGAPPNGEAESETPSLDPWQEMKKNWIRPSGPAKVALQVGHLNNETVPEELKNIKGNTGASGGGYTEVQANLIIAEETAKLLRAEGIEVELLPATIPPDYWADIFIAIHADGSTDPSISGFKIAGPWRDLTGNSKELVEFLETSYSETTFMKIDPNITRNMRGYYAFSWWRYEHSIHPMTTAAIVETGFITNKADRNIIVHQPEIPSQAISKGIINYLRSKQIL